MPRVQAEWSGDSDIDHIDDSDSADGQSSNDADDTSKEADENIDDDGSESSKDAKFSTKRRFYREGYRRVLNDAIEAAARRETRAQTTLDAVTSHSSDSQDDPPGSPQTVSTLDSAGDQEVSTEFYDAMSHHRLQLHGTLLPALSRPLYSRDVGHKGFSMEHPLETQELLHRLQTPLRKMNHYERNCGGSSTQHYQPAKELSASCVSALDQAADAMGEAQLQYDRRLEQAKYGSLWRLSRRTARWAQHCLRTDIQELRDRLPQAELLNLGKFLTLSTRIFMNSSDLSLNWTTYATNHERPHFLRSAFIDLHSIAMDVIRRLVRTTFYITLAHDKSETPKVRRSQVEAAVELLGLPHNSQELWQTLTQRHSLVVEGEAEKPHTPPPGKAEEMEIEEPDERVEQKYLEYLEDYDFRQSLAEECRMWRALGKNPKLEMAVVRKKKTRSGANHRKIDGQDHDWRHNTRFAAEWECHH